MTDDAFLNAFEQGRLAPAAFRHRDHLRLAWISIRTYGAGPAETRVSAGLRAMAARAGRPDKFDGALTRAWIAAVDEAQQRTGARSFEQFAAAHPELLDPAAIARTR